MKLQNWSSKHHEILFIQPFPLVLVSEVVQERRLTRTDVNKILYIAKLWLSQHEVLLIYVFLFLLLHFFLLLFILRQVGRGIPNDRNYSALVVVLVLEFAVVPLAHHERSFLDLAFPDVLGPRLAPGLWLGHWLGSYLILALIVLKSLDYLYFWDLVVLTGGVFFVETSLAIHELRLVETPLVYRVVKHKLVLRSFPCSESGMNETAYWLWRCLRIFSLLLLSLLFRERNDAGRLKTLKLEFFHKTYYKVLNQALRLSTLLGQIDLGAKDILAELNQHWLSVWFNQGSKDLLWINETKGVELPIALVLHLKGVWKAFK